MEKKWVLKSVCNGNEIEVNKPEFNVGRNSTQDLVCYSVCVSREHAKLSLESGDLFVTAFKSMNGTWINSKQLVASQTQQLYNNDHLNFGYPEHLECDGSDNHYCYTVILRTSVVDMSSTMDLLEVLEDDTANQANDEIEPNALDIQIKQELNTTSSFSYQDDIIVLDDDDDLEIACSQAFAIQNQKNEDLDDIIEIDSDSFSIADSDHGLEAGRDVQDDDNNNGTCTSIISPPPQILECDKITEKEVDRDTKENEINVMEEEETCDREEILSKPVIDRSFVHKSKYQKPEIIQPHTITKDRVGRKRRRTISQEIHEKKKQFIESVNSEAKPKNRGRRKSTIENESNNKKNQVADKQVLSNLTATKPPEAKRSNGHTQTRGKNHRPDQNQSNATQSKFTGAKPSPLENNRSNGYAQTRQNNQKQDKIKLNPTSEIKSQLPKTTLRNGHMKTIPNNQPVPAKPNLKRPKLTETKRSPSKTSRSNGQIATRQKKPEQSSTVQDSQPSTSSASTVLEDPRLTRGSLRRSEKPLDGYDPVLRCHVSRSVRSEPVNVQRAYPLLERASRSLAFAIVYWNTTWLSQQKGIDEYPPINADLAVRMCVTFNNHGDYVKVVEPFIKFEIWDHLMRGHDMLATNRSKVMRISIRELIKFNAFQIAKCIMYITNAQNTKRDHPKEADVIGITVAMRLNPTSHQVSVMRLFGLVLSSKKTKLRPHDLIYTDLLSKIKRDEQEYQLEIHVLMKPLQGEILLAKCVDAIPLTSATSLMRECDAVHMLVNSPICKMILNPKVSDLDVEVSKNLKFIEGKVLTQAQKAAVRKACSLCLGEKPGMYLIQGPPGTGKTTVIHNIVETLIRSKPDIRILLVAPSNASTDSLVKKIGTTKQQKQHRKSTVTDDIKIKMVRLGNYESVHKDVKGFFIDDLARKQGVADLLTQRPELRMDYDRLQKIRQDLQEKIEKDRALDLDIAPSEAELISVEKKLRNFVPNCVTESRYLRILEEKRRQLIFGSNIICTTLSSCVRLQEFGVGQNFIDCCILDEASQSKETETLIPLMLGVKKLIMVGDPQQLPPVTLSRIAKDLDYGQSLFSRIKKAMEFEKDNPITLLDVQFRMHPDICNYPNDKFYRGALTTAPTCSQRGSLAKLMPYYVLNLNIRKKTRKESYANKEEIECVLMLLEAIHMIIHEDATRKVSVGVITPYNAQKDGLKMEINKMRTKWSSLDVIVNTVDSFQGAEKDIIILSCVRVRPNSFLSDEQRLNVALTRAKQALYVIGTHPIFDTCQPLKQLRLNAEARKLYLNVKEVNISILKTLIEKR